MAHGKHQKVIDHSNLNAERGCMRSARREQPSGNDLRGYGKDCLTEAKKKGARRKEKIQLQHTAFFQPEDVIWRNIVLFEKPSKKERIIAEEFLAAQRRKKYWAEINKKLAA